MTDTATANSPGHQPLGLPLNDQLGLLAPEWAMHIAAQCWCEPTTSMIEMDSRLALVFAAKLAAERERHRAALRDCVLALIGEMDCSLAIAQAQTLLRA